MFYLLNINTMRNGITDTFDPIKAINTLRENVVELTILGEKIEAKRNQLILKMAELMDAETLARQEVFDKEIKASLVRDFIKLKISKQEKDHSIVKEELKILEDRKNILIEVNNSLKASHRIHEMEARNLNL